MTRHNQRTSKLIQREISKLLEREVNDPRLCKMISVTRVTLSTDFKHADIYVSTLGDDINKKDITTGLNSAAGFLRRELASHLQLKSTPQLSFHYDESIEQGARLLELIDHMSTPK